MWRYWWEMMMAIAFTTTTASRVTVAVTPSRVTLVRWLWRGPAPPFPVMWPHHTPNLFAQRGMMGSVQIVKMGKIHDRAPVVPVRVASVHNARRKNNYRNYLNKKRQTLDLFKSSRIWKRCRSDIHQTT